jgi:hypothetical protein
MFFVREELREFFHLAKTGLWRWILDHINPITFQRAIVEGKDRYRHYVANG